MIYHSRWIHVLWRFLPLSGEAIFDAFHAIYPGDYSSKILPTFTTLLTFWIRIGPDHLVLLYKFVRPSLPLLLVIFYERTIDHRLVETSNMPSYAIADDPHVSSVCWIRRETWEVRLWHWCGIFDSHSIRFNWSLFQSVSGWFLRVYFLLWAHVASCNLAQRG